LPEEEYQGVLDEQQLFFRELLTINKLASVTYTGVDTSWSKNVRNYCNSIDHFEATVARHLDREYYMKLGKIRSVFKKKLLDFRATDPSRGTTDLGKQFEVDLSLLYSRRKLTVILLKLDEKGVFAQRSVHATPPDVDRKRELEAK